MNYKDPIDITAVNTAVKKHGKSLDAIDRLGADVVLRHATGYSDITDSYTFNKATLTKVSSKYTGVFKGLKHIGEFIPRTLTVHPIVIEVLDEPERYRRSWVAEVRGGLDIAKHPFELWLIQEILKQASNDLLGALFTAKLSASSDKVDVADSFDGWGTIVENEKTAGNITTAKGNMVSTGAFTRADVGDQLLAMYRSRDRIFKNANSKMFISDAVGDLYDDWFADEHPNVHTPGQNPDETGQQFLYGSKGKCELVRVPDLPEGSNFAMLTLQPNLVYGYDKQSDMRSMKAVPDDYMFKALGKYVFGCQIPYIGKELFCVNDQSLTPVAGASETPAETPAAGE